MPLWDSLSKVSIFAVRVVTNCTDGAVVATNAVGEFAAPKFPFPPAEAVVGIGVAPVDIPLVVEVGTDPPPPAPTEAGAVFGEDTPHVK